MHPLSNRATLPTIAATMLLTACHAPKTAHTEVDCQSVHEVEQSSDAVAVTTIRSADSSTTIGFVELMQPYIRLPDGTTLSASSAHLVVDQRRSISTDVSATDSISHRVRVNSAAVSRGKSLKSNSPAITKNSGFKTWLRKIAISVFVIVMVLLALRFLPSLVRSLLRRLLRPL